MRTALFTLLLCILPLSPAPAEAGNMNLAEEAEAAMKKACSYLMDEVSCNGGFVWYYLPDFSRRWGELEASPTMIWLQDPGTAGVGDMLLDAYDATGDEFYYSAAEKVAAALIHAQLDCGGWNYVYDFSGRDSLIRWYDTVGASAWRLEEFQEFMDNATFDDGCTVCCTRMLLRLYQKKLDPKYRPAIDKALALARETQDAPVPLYLRNAPTKLMEELGYSDGYKYAHDYPGHWTDLEFMPQRLSGTALYEPADNRREAEMQERLSRMWPKYNYGKSGKSE